MEALNTNVYGQVSCTRYCREPREDLGAGAGAGAGADVVAPAEPTVLRPGVPIVIRLAVIIAPP